MDRKIPLLFEKPPDPEFKTYRLRHACSTLPAKSQSQLPTLSPFLRS